MEAESFEELVRYIRGFKSWSDEKVYDFGAIAHLLGACLDCMRNHANQGDIDDLAGYLDLEQQHFVQDLARAIRPSR